MGAGILSLNNDRMVKHFWPRGPSGGGISYTVHWDHCLSSYEKNFLAFICLGIPLQNSCSFNLILFSKGGRFLKRLWSYR